MDNYQIKQYINNSNTISIDVIFALETVWLSADQLTVLFNKSKSTISRQLPNLIKSNNLDKSSVVAQFATTALDGKTYKVSYYNLEVTTLLGMKTPNSEFIEFKDWAESTIQSHYVNLPINTENADINGKIHIIRGQQVMLDFELAEIYGYTTRRFNEQVNNKIENVLM